MGTIHRYIFRHVLIATLITTAALVFAVWLTQSMRLIEVIVDGGLGFGLFLKLVMLSMPQFLIVVLPIGMAAGLLFAYHRLFLDGELQVMRAAGMSPRAIARPAFILAILVALIGLGLNLYVWPAANREFRDLRNIANSAVSAALLREGEFTTINRSLTIYIRSRDGSGSISGIIVHDQKDPNFTVTLLAERGAVTEEDGSPRVVLYDGLRQEFDRRGRQLQSLGFDRYSVDLRVIAPETAARMRRDASERQIEELLWPNLDDPDDVEMYDRLVMEGHSRLSAPLMPIAFALLVVGILTSGDFNRRGIALRVLIAIVAVAILQAATIGIGGAGRNDSRLAPALYLVPALGIIAGRILLSDRLTRRARPTAREMPA